MKTEYIRWDCKNGYREDDLAHAAELLRHGGLVAFPTETVYGLGGNGLDAQAARKIYEAKGRPGDNPLILHISKREELYDIVKSVPVCAERLMDAFWPGPVTLIFEKSVRVPVETTGGLSTVAVRMPEHQGARQLIGCAGVPIAAPSANTSGRPSPTKAEHVIEDLDGKIDMIIDGGDVGVGLESTIIDVTGEVPVILRPGYITRDMIERLLGEVRVDRALIQSDSTVRPRAPGMKYRHYAPKADMTVYEGPLDSVVKKINHMAACCPGDKVGILATEETRDKYPHGQVVVVGSRQKNTIAQGLFDALRTFDHLGVEVIFSEGFSAVDKQEAIMNRLKKAAGNHIEYLEESENVQ